MANGGKLRLDQPFRPLAEIRGGFVQPARFDNLLIEPRRSGRG